MELLRSVQTSSFKAMPAVQETGVAPGAGPAAALWIAGFAIASGVVLGLWKYYGSSAETKKEEEHEAPPFVPIVDYISYPFLSTTFPPDHGRYWGNPRLFEVSPPTGGARLFLASSGRHSDPDGIVRLDTQDDDLEEDRKERLCAVLRRKLGDVELAVRTDGADSARVNEAVQVAVRQFKSTRQSLSVDEWQALRTDLSGSVNVWQRTLMLSLIEQVDKDTQPVLQKTVVEKHDEPSRPVIPVGTETDPYVARVDREKLKTPAIERMAGIVRDLSALYDPQGDQRQLDPEFVRDASDFEDIVRGFHFGMWAPMMVDLKQSLGSPLERYIADYLAGRIGADNPMPWSLYSGADGIFFRPADPVVRELNVFNVCGEWFDIDNCKLHQLTEGVWVSVMGGMCMIIAPSNPKRVKINNDYISANTGQALVVPGDVVSIDGRDYQVTKGTMRVADPAMVYPVYKVNKADIGELRKLNKDPMPFVLCIDPLNTYRLFVGRGNLPDFKYVVVARGTLKIKDGLVKINGKTEFDALQVMETMEKERVKVVSRVIASLFIDQ